jgi:hypothetical protein
MDWEFAEVMLQGYPGGRYCEDVPADNESPPNTAPSYDTPADSPEEGAPEEQAPRVLRFAYVAGVTPG